MTSKHLHLEQWLISNGTRPFYSLNVNINSSKDCSTAKALCDLHNMMSQESDEYITSFFVSARSRIKAQLKDNSVQCLETRNWPPESD